VNRGRRDKNIIGRQVAEARESFKPPLTQDALSGRLARLGIHLDELQLQKSKIITVEFLTMN
jgi:hypothetical protein